MSLKRMNEPEKQGQIVASPVDLILVAHDGLRHDLADIDASIVTASRQRGDVQQAVERLEFFTSVLAWHAKGEDDGIFPALERVAPDVANSYELDHRGLDLAADGLYRAIDTSDMLEIARATAVFKFHLDLHLHEEEVDLYPLFVDRLSGSDQTEAVRVFTDALPTDRFGDFVRWLFPLVGTSDRAKVVRVWQAAMPEAIFAGTMGLVRNVIGEEYADLAEDVPSIGEIASFDANRPAVEIPPEEVLVSFDTHIKLLFREQDRRSMSFAFDLWSFEDVKAHAGAILARLENGSMPCDGAWPSERIATFKRWIESGVNP